MTAFTSPSAFGTIDEQATLVIERLLPGPIERIWDYLTKSEMRRQWLASGDMALEPGATFTFTWRNDELTDPPGTRPEGYSAEHSMEGRIVAVDPPHKLDISWGRTGGVTFTLKPRGKDVLLTIEHRRIPDRDMLLNIGAGWHMHLNVLAAKVRGETPTPFWNGWSALKGEYAQRLPS